MDYELLKEFFQKYFVLHEQSAVENSFSTYVCYAPDGLFWLNLYLDSRGTKIRINFRATKLCKVSFKLHNTIVCMEYFGFNDVLSTVDHLTARRKGCHYISPWKIKQRKFDWSVSSFSIFLKNYCIDNRVVFAYQVFGRKGNQEKLQSNLISLTNFYQNWFIINRLTSIWKNILILLSFLICPFWKNWKNMPK